MSTAGCVLNPIGEDPGFEEPGNGSATSDGPFPDLGDSDDSVVDDDESRSNDDVQAPGLIEGPHIDPTPPHAGPDDDPIGAGETPDDDSAEDDSDDDTSEPSPLSDGGVPDGGIPDGGQP